MTTAQLPFGPNNRSYVALVSGYEPLKDELKTYRLPWQDEETENDSDECKGPRHDIETSGTEEDQCANCLQARCEIELPIGQTVRVFCDGLHVVAISLSTKVVNCRSVMSRLLRCVREGKERGRGNSEKKG